VAQDPTTLRVLVVDDNAHMRAILKAILDNAGVREVREAGDGTAALAILGNWRCDVAVVDYNMTPMDGLEFTKRLRDRAVSPDPTLPVVMVTGHADTARVIAARDAGITEFVVKPVTAKEVLQKVSAALRQRATLQTRRDKVQWVP
jgi:two-component system chemotaxis response regulator CheY